MNLFQRTPIGQWLITNLSNIELPIIYFEDDQNKWQSMTAGEFLKQVEICASVLSSVPLTENDRVLIFANNCWQWEAFEKAAHVIGISVFGIETYSQEKVIKDLIEQSAPTHIVVGDLSLVPKLQHLITDRVKLCTLMEGAGQGRWKNYQEIDCARSAVNLNSLPVLQDPPSYLVFSSGTSSSSKGFFFTQKQALGNVEIQRKLFSFIERQDLTLCWLPITNLFQRMINLTAIETQNSICFCRDPKQVMRYLRKVRPSIFCSVPRFYQKVDDQVNLKVDRWSFLPGFLRRWIKKQMVHLLFGGRVRYCISGSAPLNAKVEKDFQDWGLPIYQAYGMSENILPISIQLGFKTLQSVGKVIPPNVVILSDRQEIMVQSPYLRKYILKDQRCVPIEPEVFYATGDLGLFDTEKNLYLNGRSSQMLKSSNGRQIQRSKIEAFLELIKPIEHAMVVGHGRAFTVAVVTLFTTSMSVEELMKLQTQIQKMNAELAHYEQLRGMIVLLRPFSIEKGELTTNLKMRPTQIEKNLSAEIDRLYRWIELEATSAVTHQNLEQDSGYCMLIMPT